MTPSHGMKVVCFLYLKRTITRIYIYFIFKLDISFYNNA
jgi:hypothetical protein